MSTVGRIGGGRRAPARAIASAFAAFLSIAPLALDGRARADEPPAAKAPARSPGSVAGFPDLQAGLRATPGCLGVEAARTMGGKNVLFAWFENKAAVLRWYYSEMHQDVMGRFFPNREAHKPLEEIADDSGPILAIASITMADSAQFAANSLPISQIAIELYQPISGGLFLGGRFAPESVHVDDMHDYTPKGGKGGEK